MNNPSSPNYSTNKPRFTAVLLLLTVTGVIRGIASIIWWFTLVFSWFPSWGIDLTPYWVIVFVILFLQGVLALVASLFALLRKNTFAGILMLASVFIGDLLSRIAEWVNSIMEGWTFTFRLPGQWVFGAEDVDVLAAIADFSFYPALVIAVLTLVIRPKVNPSAFELPLAPGNAPVVSAMGSVEPKTTKKQETKMSDTKQWEVMIPGAADSKVDTATLALWAQAGNIKVDTIVKEISTGASFPASQIPGVFSDKQYIVALLLSLFLGGLGIDRFYTGHTGMGVGKLLTAGGCGVWALVDLILYAMRKVNDVNGRPLQ